MRRLGCMVLLPLAVHGAKIVLSNDDGWAEKNVRVFYEALGVAGHDVVLSAPAEDMSGTGSSDEQPTAVGSDGCEYGSCLPNSPPYGYNASDNHINYVNSYPVTAMRHGMQNLSQPLLKAAPDIAVSGPNVGGNTGITTQFSGTVGAACEAAQQGTPAIAFSGASGDHVAWTTTTQLWQAVYAGLSTTITNAILNSSTPYLPANTFLNVNFPTVNAGTCNSTSRFQFVMSRINIPLFADDDVETCGSSRLPTESDVVGNTSGCYASISVGDASSKLDVDAATQKVVLDKLAYMLSCLSSGTSSTPTATSATASTSTHSPSATDKSLAPARMSAGLSIQQFIAIGLMFSVLTFCL